MQFSDNIYPVLKKFEGFQNKPYLDAKGVPTIGYGSTYYEDGRKVTMQDQEITQDQALRLLKIHLEKEVLKYIEKWVKVDLTQNQIDALGSLIYNIGAGNFGKSTLLKKINESAPEEDVKNQWLSWKKSGGKVLNGLITRRKAEWELYTKK